VDERQILELLDQGSLAPEQIADNLRVDVAKLRPALDSMRARGLVEISGVSQWASDLSTARAHWRLTDAGRAQLEQLRSED